MNNLGTVVKYQYCHQEQQSVRTRRIGSGLYLAFHLWNIASFNTPFKLVRCRTSVTADFCSICLSIRFYGNNFFFLFTSLTCFRFSHNNTNSVKTFMERREGPTSLLKAKLSFYRNSERLFTIIFCIIGYTIYRDFCPINICSLLSILCFQRVYFLSDGARFT